MEEGRDIYDAALLMAPEHDRKPLEAIHLNPTWRETVGLSPFTNQ